MQAGRLDKRATFRGRPQLDDDGFESRGGYQDLFTVRAEFRPLSGRAMAEAGSLTDAALEAVVVELWAPPKGRPLVEPFRRVAV